MLCVPSRDTKEKEHGSKRAEWPSGNLLQNMKVINIRENEEPLVGDEGSAPVEGTATQTRQMPRLSNPEQRLKNQVMRNLLEGKPLADVFDISERLSRTHVGAAFVGSPSRNYCSYGDLKRKTEEVGRGARTVAESASFDPYKSSAGETETTPHLQIASALESAQSVERARSSQLIREATAEGSTNRSRYERRVLTLTCRLGADAYLLPKGLTSGDLGEKRRGLR